MTLKSALTKIVPYASFPYADHALREIGVENPGVVAECDAETVGVLVKAAQFIRSMVSEMDGLEELRGYITFTEEEQKKNDEEE